MLAAELDPLITGALLASLGALIGLMGWVLKEVRQTRVDLVAHMGTEDTQRAKDDGERVAARKETDSRLTALEEGQKEIARTIGDGLSLVHRRVDAALQTMAAGNPEVRRE